MLAVSKIIQTARRTKKTSLNSCRRETFEMLAVYKYFQIIYFQIWFENVNGEGGNGEGENGEGENGEKENEEGEN